MPLDLDEIERLERAATSAPWINQTYEKSAHVEVRGAVANKNNVRSSDGTGPIAIIECALEPDAVMFSPMDAEQLANAALIAALRNAARAMIARIRELEATVAVHARRAEISTADRAQSSVISIEAQKQNAALRQQLAERDARIGELREGLRQSSHSGRDTA